jgi:hypothetical protein
MACSAAGDLPRKERHRLEPRKGPSKGGAGRRGQGAGRALLFVFPISHTHSVPELVLRIHSRESIMHAFRRKYILPLAAVIALTASTLGWIAVANGQEPQSVGEQSRTCTLASLHGHYGNQLSGVALQPNGTTALRFEANGVEIFDGAGHTHGTFTNQNSQFGSLAGTFTGTYTVMADCTGLKELTVSITQPAGVPAVHAAYQFVIVADGREVLYHGTTTELNTVEQGQLVRQ